MSTPRQAHPGDLVARACAQHGTATVVASSTALLAGAAPDDVDVPLDMLGGFARYLAGSDAQYWSRVWAARALRYAWVEGGETGRAAETALVAGLDDEHWRVREMCARVVALHELGAAGDPLARLLSDGVPRVRAAAARALGVVGEHEHLAALGDATDDPADAVATAARRAVTQLAQRLDLPLG